MNAQVVNRLNKVSKYIILVYVTSYMILALLGEYKGPVSHGEKIYREYGLSALDTYLWQPAGMVLTENNFNLLGGIYSPLIVLDRLVWHQNLRQNAFDAPNNATPLPAN